MKLLFRRIYSKNTISYATDGSAGLDLFAAYGAVIEKTIIMVPTGVAVAIPEGHVGLLCIRSGLATKSRLRLANGIGVIDSDYRGEILVALVNDAHEAYCVNQGDRIAQLVLVPAPRLELEEATELHPTARDVGGFGSTGRLRIFLRQTTKFW